MTEVLELNFNHPDPLMRIEAKLDHLIRKQAETMADLTNLNAAVGDLNTEVAAVQTYIQGLQSSDDQAGVDAATASITAATATLTGLVAPAAAVVPADGTEPAAS